MVLSKCFYAAAFLSASLLSVSEAAWAGGYQVNLQGQRQIGMGNTGVAFTNDASSIFFNPGAVARMPKSGVVLGGSFIFSKVKYLSATTNTVHETESPTGTPFALYAAYKINDKMAAGLGVYTPFGSSVKWTDGWEGRYALESIKLQAITVQPTFSYKINDMISVGAGLTYTFGSVALTRGVPLTAADGSLSRVTLEGKGSGIGFNLGVSAELNEKLSIGASYRSASAVGVQNGSATFTVPGSVASNFPNANFEASLPLPSVISLGAAYRPSEKLLVSAEVNYVGWSAYKELKFKYDTLIAGSSESVSKRNYKNAFIFKLGLEYAIKENLFVRAGTYFDQSPVPDGYMTAETPDSNTLGYSFGIGYKIGEAINIDASVLFVDRAKRENVAAPDANTLSGTFHAGAVIPGISVGINF